MSGTQDKHGEQEAGQYRSIQRAFFVNVLLAPLAPTLLVAALVMFQYDKVCRQVIAGSVAAQARSAALVFQGLRVAQAQSVAGPSAEADRWEATLVVDSVRGKGEAVAIRETDGRLAATSTHPAGADALFTMISALNLDDPVAELGSFDLGGKEYMWAAAALPDRRSLVFVIDAGASLKPLQRARWVALLVVVGAFLLIGLKAYALSRKLSRRISKADEERQRLNERMFQTAKLASIGELAAGVAHEINNPIAVMIEEAGWMQDLLDDELLANSPNLGEFKRSLEQIRIQGGRCREITRKLLSFARVSDGEAGETSVTQLLDDLLSVIGKRAQKRHVALRSEIEQSLPMAPISHTELQQVLFNLINNAMDAMDASGGELFISAKSLPGAIRVEIGDTGAGISAENRGRVFDPFFTTKAVGHGSGLGLSICYGIIQKWGGRLAVESRPDKGSLFWFTIPLRPKSAAQGQGEAPGASVAGDAAEKPTPPSRETS